MCNDPKCHNYQPKRKHHQHRRNQAQVDVQRDQVIIQRQADVDVERNQVVIQDQNVRHQMNVQQDQVNVKEHAQKKRTRRRQAIVQANIPLAYTVTVGPKMPNHPFFSQGSPLGFFINGRSGPTLVLRRGQTYIFNITTPGHPFYFTTDPRGGTGRPTGSLQNVPPVTNGTLTFTVTNNMPNMFYYQCMIHPNMGSFVQVVN